MPFLPQCRSNVAFDKARPSKRKNIDKAFICLGGIPSVDQRLEVQLPGAECHIRLDGEIRKSSAVR